MTTIQLHYKKENHINTDSLAKSFTLENQGFVKSSECSKSANSYELRSPEFPRTPSAARPEYFTACVAEAESEGIRGNSDHSTACASSSPIDYNPFHIRDIQNYNPVYGQFFELSDSNYAKITLNQKYGIRESSVVERETGTIVDKPVFFKFAPLLDPIRYMIGRYDLTDPTLKQLPTISNADKCFPKIADPNNVAYVDSFFCYLGSQLLEKHNVFHATDFYGSYLGIQEWFKTNITDEMEYLHSSEFFGEHLNKEFYVDNDTFAEYMDYGSRKHRKRIIIDSRVSNLSLGAEHFDVAESPIVSENSKICGGEAVVDSKIYGGEAVVNSPAYSAMQAVPLSVETLETETLMVDREEVYEKHNQTTSTYMSNSSDNSAELNYSTDEDQETKNPDTVKYSGGEAVGVRGNSGERSSSEFEDQEIEDPDTEDQETEDPDTEDQEQTCSTYEMESFGFIKDFPTQMICMEKCHGTLDDLFVSDALDVDQSAACLFQVIMSLIVFQKAFHFTHNDLHTNNIMYVNTEVEHLYYSYNHKYYRVPTYGRIFKIIDFGRSIYKFQGKTFCSDSFAPCGDAYAQYNCEPYMNEKKPRIDPNPSFDLCRLGCSIFDFIIEDMEHPKTELQKTIVRWCSDDNGRNVLYKRNGEERYPSFKLYKMIARNVHRHTPHEQLKFPYFRQFEMSVSKMKEIDVSTILQNGINVDEIPPYTC
jgi:hypothetical protein